ncbi:MAG TPA: fluoride efflux transporter CrcB [Micromonosporaceae bacterium]|nr:fluoride efflux transporter CrcB [Micromonosporaceae bacterium]
MDELRPHHLPIDSDIDLHVERQRTELLRTHGAVLAAISVGGAIGALARYGLGVAFPPGRTGFPWATFGINVVGSLLIGILMVLVVDVWEAHPLVRPFLGVGILGGFTTFSTYVVDAQRLVNAGAAATALAYLAATLAGAIFAVYVGLTITRAAVGRRAARRATERERVNA